jgi:hypothetical protein
MKKLMIALLPLTIFVTAAFASDNNYYVYAERGAQTSTEAQNDFDGMYLRLASGVALSSVQRDKKGVATPVQIPFAASLGLSHVWNQFYLGGEAQFGWNFIPSKAGYQTNGKLNHNTKWQTMATVQLGGVISNTNIVYADAGYAFSDFSYMDSKNAERTYLQGGPVAGFGVSLQLSDHINFDMNYDFVYYLNKTGLKNSGNIKANQNIVTAGISIHF